MNRRHARLLRTPLQAPQCKGFTLIEMIIALTLIGILAAMTSVFIRAPLESHFAARQRIDLADSIEPSLRLLDNELRQALPNSVRVTPDGLWLEFLASRASGRYRSGSGGPGGGCPGPGGNQLDFGIADSCFTTLGQVVINGSAIVAGNDFVVVNNQGPGFALDAYQSGANKSLITNFTASFGPPPRESRLRYNNFTFTAAPTSQLFYVVSGPVTYYCNQAAGQLVRYSGYSINATQPTPPAGGAQSVIVANLASCAFRYDKVSNVLNQGLVTLDMTMASTSPSQNRESVPIWMQVPVSKTP